MYQSGHNTIYRHLQNSGFGPVQKMCLISLAFRTKMRQRSKSSFSRWLWGCVHMIQIFRSWKLNCSIQVNKQTVFTCFLNACLNYTNSETQYCAQHLQEKGLFWFRNADKDQITAFQISNGGLYQACQTKLHHYFRCSKLQRKAFIGQSIIDYTDVFL